MTRSRKKYVVIYIEGQNGNHWSLLQLINTVKQLKWVEKKKENFFPVNTYCTDFRGRIFNQQVS